MSKIVKNIKIKLFFIFCMFMILFRFLLFLNPQIFLVFRGIYGGVPLSTLPSKLGFLFIIILLQYINIDAIMYYLNNASYLMNRYGSKKKLIYTLFRSLLVLNLIFVCLSGVGMILSTVLNGYNLFEINYIEFVEVMMRGYLTCLTISMAQVLLLIIFDEARTFMLLICLSLVFIFLSKYDMSFLAILPVRLEGVNLLFNIAICIIVLIFFTSHTKARFFEKEFY